MTELLVPTAGDWMSKNVLTFLPKDDLFDAIDQLLTNHYAAAPVVDEEGTLVGMLTEKDCLRILSNVAYENDLVGGEVQELHSAIRAVASPGMDLFRVTELFLSTNFPLLPVVDDGHLVGVISRRDLLRGVKAFREALNRAQGHLERTAGHQSDRPRSIESMQRSFAQNSRDQMVRLFRRR